MNFVLDDIERAYNESLVVDPGYIGFDDVKRDLARGKDRILARLKDNPHRRLWTTPRPSTPDKFSTLSMPRIGKASLIMTSSPAISWSPSKGSSCSISAWRNWTVH